MWLCHDYAPWLCTFILILPHPSQDYSCTSSLQWRRITWSIKNAAGLLGYNNLCLKEEEAIISFIPSIPKHFKQTTVELGTSIHSFSKGTTWLLANNSGIRYFHSFLQQRHYVTTRKQQWNQVPPSISCKGTMWLLANNSGIRYLHPFLAKALCDY